jgi:hypothetical protein
MSEAGISATQSTQCDAQAANREIDATHASRGMPGLRRYCEAVKSGNQALATQASQRVAVFPSF